MNLQFLNASCLPHQAKNPETGKCYDVCAPGEKYDGQSGCVSLNWYKDHWMFLTAFGVLAAYAWWRLS
jgi:hypothetical protein